MIENNKRFASLSNFKASSINRSNYHGYLSKKGNRRLEITFRILKERMENGDEGLKYHFDSI